VPVWLIFSRGWSRASRSCRDFRGAIALAVNYEYSAGATELRDNDEVALIPPVSGGLVNEPSTAETALPLISEHARITGGPIKTAPILAAIKHPKTAR